LATSAEYRSLDRSGRLPKERIRPASPVGWIVVLTGAELQFRARDEALLDTVACYHDVMSKKVTTVRMPQELADTVDAVARGRGVSVNTVVLDALSAEIERVKNDKEFMGRLREITQRDKEILDRLAE
jgi:hypothetical protein